MSTTEYLAFIACEFAKPIELVRVIDVDGREYETDANKLASIATDKVEYAMSQPDLRKLIVTRIP